MIARLQGTGVPKLKAPELIDDGGYECREADREKILNKS
jgi:hypothetical protein